MRNLVNAVADNAARKKPEAAKITTFTGRQVDPFALRVDDIDWNDVVAVLPRLPRFNGHTRFAYSVAQHSVLVASLCKSRAAKQWGLMHDVAEIYLHDVPTPIKNRLLCRVPCGETDSGEHSKIEWCHHTFNPWIGCAKEMLDGIRHLALPEVA